MMKLFLIVVLIVMLAFSLVACGNGGEDASPGEIVATQTPQPTPVPSPAPSLAPEPTPYPAEYDSPRREFTTDQFLDDLDYLIWVLENNFPFFYTAYWARGVDINQLADNARRTILEADELDEDIFIRDIMWEIFQPLFSVGHFAFINPLEYHMIRMGILGLSPIRSELMDSPNVQAFYRARVTDDFPDINEIMERIPDMSITIMEDESIAVLTIPSFVGTSEEDLDKISELYAKLYSFDHFIIDIRNNGGGWMSFFNDLIMSPLIDSTAVAEMFVFFKDGEYITTLTPRYLLGGIIPARPATNDIFGSVSEIIEQNDFAQLVQNDIDRFVYAFPANMRIMPPLGIEKVDFNGSIWMLVDERVGSAAQAAAWMAKDSGFATLVGEITGGNFGGTRLHFAMPNTGILFQFDAFYITDRYGRPLEAGTIPHHFNHPGMDAMETVLALIAEGEY